MLTKIIKEKKEIENELNQLKEKEESLLKDLENKKKIEKEKIEKIRNLTVKNDKLEYENNSLKEKFERNEKNSADFNDNYIELNNKIKEEKAKCFLIQEKYNEYLFKLNFIYF